MKMYTWNDGSTLQHHGILGQKWGIRRYQNYDGSYTQAGLKRYNTSKDNYLAAKKNRQFVSRMVKDTNKYGYYLSPSTGQKFAVSKQVKKEAKDVERNAKRKMNKDYKHLALDMKADKGKNRYAKGQRITNNNRILSAVAKLSTGIAVGAEYLNQAGMISKDNARYAQYASAGLAAVTAMGYLLAEIPNNELRAYYAHTSNY